MATLASLAFHAPAFSCKLTTTSKSAKSHSHHRIAFLSYTRRCVATTALATVLLATEAVSNSNLAFSLDFRVTVPDQTPEEAEIGIRTHAQDLLNIKPLVDSQSWKDAQKALRQSSGFLRQDLYTIIQSKPGKLRPPLRRLYTQLFNSVTKMDYAARSKDVEIVYDCYDNIVSTLNDILAMI
ncbi:hypothetical protein ACLOJK_017218 [Asimina triloba]